MDNLEHELGLHDVQKAALGILNFLDGLCSELGLRYWLAYGTAIGAIRHNGFIPWDDDIDICMPRSDYDKLLNYFFQNKEELYPYVAVGPTAANPTPFLITRITDMRYVMKGEFGDEVRLGSFVDVYPLDGLGNRRGDAERHKMKMKKLATDYFRAGNWDYYNRNTSAAKRAFKKAVSGFWGTAGTCYSRLIKEAAKFDFETSEFVSVVVGMTYLPFCRRACFGGTIAVEFEGLKAPLPCGYDEILKTFYGDYMSLPPEQERVGRHFYKLYRIEG